MKVLVLTEPGESGVFTYVEALCHFLVEQGASVHLGYSDVRGSDRLTTLVAYVEAQGGRTVNMRVGSGVGLGDVRAFFRLRRLAGEVRPDVIHCHSSKAGSLGRMLAFAGTRSAVTYHPQAYYGMRPGQRSTDIFYNAIESVLGRVGTTIASSAGERQFAIERLGLNPARVCLIANGVHMDRFSPAGPEEKQALRDGFGIPRGRVVLGAMSRLSAQKDPVTLYRAFARAAAERPDLHLFHVGTGELQAEVDAVIAELGIESRLTRLPYLSNPTGFYKAVDGFVLTSTYEGLSIASLEALAADLPLILSRAPGNNDIIDLQLSHTWAAAIGDVPGFAAAFGLWHEKHLLHTPSNHRDMARQRFDYQVNLGRVFAHYREILGKAPGVATWSVWFPVVAWFGLISLESTRFASRANTRELFYPPVHFLTGVSYEDFSSWNFVIRKVGHVLLYGTLSVFLYRWAHRERATASPRTWSLSCAALAVLGTFLVASLDEWHQTMLPSRTGTIWDVILDTSAAVIAQVLVFGLSGILWRAGRAPSGARPQSPPTPPKPSGLPGMGAESTGSQARS